MYVVPREVASVVASNRKNELKPVAVSEYGTIGPQGMELVDIIFSRAHDPASMKTYMMRRLAVVTATRTHRRLHGQVRGHMALRPAAARGGPGATGPVADGGRRGDVGRAGERRAGCRRRGDWRAAQRVRGVGRA